MSEKDLLLDECACGHVLDEHEHTGSSTPPCAIEGCDCIAFESVEGSDPRGEDLSDLDRPGRYIRANKD